MGLASFDFHRHNIFKSREIATACVCVCLSKDLVKLSMDYLNVEVLSAGFFSPSTAIRMLREGGCVRVCWRTLGLRSHPSLACFYGTFIALDPKFKVWLYPANCMGARASKRLEGRRKNGNFWQTGTRLSDGHQRGKRTS